MIPTPRVDALSRVLSNQVGLVSQSDHIEAWVHLATALERDLARASANGGSYAGASAALMQEAAQALDDWIVTYVADSSVDEAWERISDGGGTLAYAGRIKAALMKQASLLAQAPEGAKINGGSRSLSEIPQPDMAQPLAAALKAEKQFDAGPDCHGSGDTARAPTNSTVPGGARAECIAPNCNCPEGRCAVAEDVVTPRAASGGERSCPGMSCRQPRECLHGAPCIRAVSGEGLTDRESNERDQIEQDLRAQRGSFYP